MYDFSADSADCARAIEAGLSDYLSGARLSGPGPASDRVVAAMRHGSLEGGKRLRPLLLRQAAAIFSIPRETSLLAGMAVEMVHCYSLVHDDLPAMDDDELRRGQPTCHVAFDEATAILAGDALLTRAFEVLADPATHSDPAVRCDLVVELSRAIGADGMVGGQMLDLVAEHHALEIPEVTLLQRMKTGMLIAFACESGAILGKAAKPVRHALHAYAHDLGLAFQIRMDRTSPTMVTGIIAKGHALQFAGSVASPTILPHSI